MGTAPGSADRRHWSSADLAGRPEQAPEALPAWLRTGCELGCKWPSSGCHRRRAARIETAAQTGGWWHPKDSQWRFRRQL